jgi:ABC-type transport system involved in Fe-S cluster assembly fused permease/ATPase subunit
MSGRNSVFAITRALRSIEGGLRYSLGFFSGMAVEFLFLCAAMGANCGTLYLLNMAATFFAYIAYTKKESQRRIDEKRSKKDGEKRQEFFLSESVQNYETVKAFGQEELENHRYGKIS